MPSKKIVSHPLKIHLSGRVLIACVTAVFESVDLIVDCVFVFSQCWVLIAASVVLSLQHDSNQDGSVEESVPYSFTQPVPRELDN